MNTNQKHYLVVMLMLISIVLVGCGNNAGSNHDHDGGLPIGSMIEVAVSIEPQSVQAGQEVMLKAEVTQDEAKVEDADEVMFEVRKSGADDSAMILGEHTGDGLYTVPYKFPDASTYFVTAHVTARGMHNMPTLEVQVTE